MKVLYITEIFPDADRGYGVWGGGEKQFWEVAKRMSRLGHRVSVLTCRFPGQPRNERRDGVEIIRAGLTRNPRTGAALASPFSVVDYLARAIRAALDIDADVIHCNAYYPILVGRVVSEIERVPLVSTVHDLPGFSTWRSYSKSSLWGLLGYGITLLSIRLARGTVITVSPQVKTKLMAHGHSDVKVIANGIDLSVLDLSGAEKEENQVLYVGRLVSYKKVEILLEASKLVLDHFPEARLVVVGGGPESESLRSLASKLGIKDHVTFTGTLKSEKDVAGYYKQSSIFVLPSIVEGEGMALKEAMGARLPVIASSAGGSGATGLIKNGQNGILVAPENSAELAGAIENLLAHPELRVKMGLAGRKAVEGNTWESVAQQVAGTYLDALRRASRRKG